MRSNRLARQTSPYLLQHQHNPVDWWAWEPEALALARAANKPIMLSIGYAACHWCHVMAHESFEDAETARRVNELFVPIKVDREERPDLDSIYQQALAMMGEQGGWPLTMFLTPAGEPFWGGTYFPPTPRYGRPSFREVLASVDHAWRTQADKVRANADILTDALARAAHPETTGTTLPRTLPDQAATWLARHVDPVDGGLEGAPKFPQPFVWELLWRGWRRTGNRTLHDAVVLTLDHICQGGITDHLGGGFHRYSTDATWLAPHFEKMLYDNALMIDLLTMVWLDTHTALYRDRVAETATWVLREMLAEGDAFAATLDADSEGEEGRFYVWELGEIERHLGPGLTRSFRDAYDTPAIGNWEGRIILHRNKPQPLAGQAFERDLAEGRAILLRARDKRIRPGRDDKVLADWNGLMISALANAGLVFDRPEWTQAARTAFDAVRRLLGRPGDRLGHSYRAGRVTGEGVLDDYANMARAAITLYEVTGALDLLAQAERWAAVADAHFWDISTGGWFFTADDAEDLLVRTKSAVDAAVPSGNGQMVHVLARLHALTGRDGYRDRAESAVAAFAGLLGQQFPAMTTLLTGWEVLDAPQQVVIVGQPEADDTRALVRAAAETAAPNRVLSILRPDQALPPGHPAHGKTPRNGHATAFVCRGQTCSAPVTSAAALRDTLSAR